MKPLLLALLLTSASAAYAEEPVPCADAQQLVLRLDREFGEKPAAGGLTDSGPAMRVYANPETRSWTMLIIDSEGTACIAAFGDGWVAAPAGTPA